jgi:NAD(P)H-dependent FMN reductase
VRDAIDALNDCPHDRVMQKPNGRPIYQCGEQNSDHVELTAVAHGGGVSSTTVLVIAGIRTRLINRGLAYAAAQSAPNGITLNVFDGFAYLPRYSEAAENQRLARSAAALRNAATEAHAAIVLTHYHGHIPAMVHDTIDWLTRRWNHSAIHDKPLAIIGPAGDRYKGVWSRHQTEDSQCITETRVIEPITVTTLHEAVTKLVEQAKPNAGNKGGQRYVPHLIAELTPEMELRGGFRAAGADESKRSGGYGYRLSGEPGRQKPPRPCRGVAGSLQPGGRNGMRPSRTRRETMRRLAKRAVIAGTSALAIMSAVGGADQLGQAHADAPPCVANVTDRCAQQDPPQVDPPHRNHIRVYCQPGGAKWGAFCRQQWVP